MQFLAIMLMSVLLWWPGAGVAQRDWEPLPPPFCGELSEADCQLLIDSQELMRTVSSFQMSISMQTGVRGIPSIADEDLTFDMQANAILHTNPELSEKMRQLILAASIEDDSQALADSYEKMVEVLLQFYETAAMDLQMQMALPQALLDTIEQEGEVPSLDQFAIEMRLLDGYLYINMDKLAEGSPELRAQLERERLNGWIGFDLVSQMRSDRLRSPANTDESLRLGIGLGRLISDEAIRQLLDPYVTVERLDDRQHDGEQVAVFRTSLDFARLAARPDFSRLLRLLVDYAGELSGEAVNEQEVGMALLAFQMFANLLARSSQFEMLQAIGIDTPYLYQQTLSVRLDLSGLLAVLALAGEELPAELRGAKPIFALKIDYGYSDFDAAPPVEKPAGAKIIPLDSLDQETINLIS